MSQQVELALQLFQAEKIDECIAQLDATAEKHHFLPPSQVMLARLFLANQQTSQGRSALEQAALTHPGHPEVYLVFGELALSEGRLTDAVLHYEKAATLPAPQSWDDSQRQYLLRETNAGLAVVAERRGDWPAARKALEAWIDAEPQNGRLRQRLANVLFQLQHNREAYEALKAANKVDATLAPAEVSMGLLHAEQGDNAKAVEWFQQAVQISPQNPVAHAAYARWLMDQGDSGQAEVEAKLAARLEPESAAYSHLCGMIARQRGRRDEAERCFEKLHRNSPANFQAANQLALVLIESPDEAKQQRAVELAEINARQYRQSPEALTTLAWVYSQIGNHQAAEQALQAALAGGSLTSDASFLLAQLLRKLERKEESQSLLTAAISAKGEFLFRAKAQQLLEEIKDSTPTNQRGTPEK